MKVLTVSYYIGEKMNQIFIFLMILIAPLQIQAQDIEACFNNEIIPDRFNSCVSEATNERINLKNIISNALIEDPGYDCSVYRNYRDRDGNYVCPSENYDACLKEYGPRLPPPYFEFVKHWCWCNCVYEPDQI